MNIFTYEELKIKAKREIDRLIKSQIDLDETSSMDHALNAAFTIYHLVEWREKTQTPIGNRSAHKIVKDIKNKGLQILHNVVTCNKHVSVTHNFYGNETPPSLEDDIEFITTEDGETLTTEDNSSLATEDSRVEVYFGTLLATEVLNDALREFS